MLILHIIIALAGIANATFGLFKPSRVNVSLSIGFTAATLSTGVLLVIQSSQYMLHTCVAGLTYTGIVLAEVLVTRRRLATIDVRGS